SDSREAGVFVGRKRAILDVQQRIASTRRSAQDDQHQHACMRSQVHQNDLRNSSVPGPTPTCVDGGPAVNHSVTPAANPTQPTMNAIVDRLPALTASLLRPTPSSVEQEAPAQP